MSPDKPVVIPGSEVPEVEQEPIEEPRAWFFSFGHGQQAMVRTNVNGLFVRIIGTFESARAEMFERFGDQWSWHYSSLAEMQPERYGMREIALEDIVAVPVASLEGRTEEQRCPNCAPGYDCERGIYGPLSEEPSGGTPALRADVVASVLDEVQALRLEIQQYGVQACRNGPGPMLSETYMELAARLDRIEAAVRGGAR